MRLRPSTRLFLVGRGAADRSRAAELVASSVLAAAAACAAEVVVVVVAAESGAGKPLKPSIQRAEEEARGAGEREVHATRPKRPLYELDGTQGPRRRLQETRQLKTRTRVFSKNVRSIPVTAPNVRGSAKYCGVCGWKDDPGPSVPRVAALFSISARPLASPRSRTHGGRRSPDRRRRRRGRARPVPRCPRPPPPPEIGRAHV